MTFQNSFSLIIGYRHTAERLANLRRVIDWALSFEGAEIILVEQDTHSKIKEANLRCRHIFVKSNIPYNRSWSFNIGYKLAKSNVIVFGDSDLIMDRNDFIESIKLLSEYEMVSPYSSVVDLQPNESNMPFETIFKIDRPGRGENDNQKLNICGGIAIFRREAVSKIGGWHEDFIGWGAEDDFQTIKVEAMLKWNERKGRCYHLYHDRPAPDMKWYQRNLQLLQKLKGMNKGELHKVIANVTPRAGMKNKYDNF
jgi:predicted glycosyltransferase involved in capsule biosynthesis